jgi:hypothetical protein
MDSFLVDITPGLENTLFIITMGQCRPASNRLSTDTISVHMPTVLSLAEGKDFAVNVL